MNNHSTRLSQLGDLLTAMIAVVLTGTSPLSVEDEVTTHNVRKIDHAEFRCGGRYFGLLSRVASRLQVSPSYVAHVFNGSMESQRILRAIAEEVRNVDATFKEIDQDILTHDERSQFGPGGRYRGIGAEVGRKLGVNSGTVMLVARGRHKSKRIMCAIREEMKRVDCDAASMEKHRLLRAVKTVAEQLSLDRNHVRNVVNGKSKSARVSEAVSSELRRGGQIWPS